MHIFFYHNLVATTVEQYFWIIGVILLFISVILVISAIILIITVFQLRKNKLFERPFNVRNGIKFWYKSPIFVVFIGAISFWIFSPIGIYWIKKYYFDIDTHISLNNFLTIGVAIGTIGAVITSLYFYIIASKDKLKFEVKKALDIGMEIINQISKLDLLTIEEAKEFNLKLDKFQWELGFIFGSNNQLSSDLVEYVVNLHTVFDSKQLLFIKEYLSKKIEIIQDYSSYGQYLENYANYIDDEYNSKLSKIFEGTELALGNYKKEYLNKARILVDSL